MPPALDPSAYPAYAAECGDPSRTKKLGFGTRSAVLLLDVCSAYTSPSSPLCLPEPVLARAISAISDILQAARQQLKKSKIVTPNNDDHDNENMPVIYAQTHYTHVLLRDAGLVALKTAHAPLFHQHDPANQLALPSQYPQIHPAPNDICLKKKYMSPFFGTNLSTQLVAMGVDTLIIAGFTTSGNVRAAALDAMQAGFRAMIVGEACADRGEETHWANLMDLGAKYGDVISVEDAVGALKI
jgi:maleamate amidohydrolase